MVNMWFGFPFFCGLILPPFHKVPSEVPTVGCAFTYRRGTWLSAPLSWMQSWMYLGHGIQVGPIRTLWKNSYSWGSRVVITMMTVSIGHVSWPHGGSSSSVGENETETQKETGSRNPMKEGTLFWGLSSGCCWSSIPRLLSHISHEISLYIQTN